MRLQRLIVMSLAVVGAASLAACASANPGWTYQPAPSITAAPSTDASAEPSGSAGPGTGGVVITAEGLAFEQADVDAPAGESFRIEFTNNDAGTPHNVAIHRDSATGEEVFKGDIFPGVETRTYDVPALDAGTYAFICTVHPTMVGTLTAE
jgi:plastocyanin